LIAAAFFGGALAVACMGALNSRRLGRLKPDTLWLMPMAVAAIATMAFAYSLALSGTDDQGLSRIPNRAIGFLLVGVLYLAHRRAFRAMKFLGLDVPSPIVPVVVAVLVQGAVQLGVGYWMGVLPWK